jgi:hypothetical protein
MSWKNTVSVAMVVGAIAFAAGRGYTQDKPAEPPKPEDMQKLFAEMRAPAEQHKALAATEGTWEGDTSMFMDPSAPPIKSKGTSVRKSINGGLYVTEEFTGDFMGTPMHGFGVHGYSKEMKKYVGFWCDNLSSTPEFLTGTADATGKVVTYEGSEMDSAMGKYTPRWVVKTEDADHVTFEHWSKSDMSAGQWVKEVEIHSTRKK